MKMPPEITFRNMERSPALQARIEQLMDRMEKFCPQIIHCRFIIEAPHRHHAQGRLFNVSIHLLVPGRDIIIDQDGLKDHSHEDPYVALRDAFKAARRQLQDYERVRRGDIKTHADMKLKRQYDTASTADK
jgi:ribosome-associated translation inhibitor RaiA